MTWRQEIYVGGCWDPCIKLLIVLSLVQVREIIIILVFPVSQLKLYASNRQKNDGICMMVPTK